jgi:hypothetical protein
VLARTRRWESRADRPTGRAVTATTGTAYAAPSKHR